MRLPTLTLLAAAAFFTSAAAAEKDCTSVALSAIPSCAQGCFLEKAPTIGCGGLDFTCQCQKQAALYAAIESCVADACPQSEFQNVIDGAETVCECAAVGPSYNTVSSSFVSHISSAPVSSIPPPPPSTTTPASSALPQTTERAPPTTTRPPVFISVPPATSGAGHAPTTSSLGVVVSFFASVFVLVAL